jgi:integrase
VKVDQGRSDVWYGKYTDAAGKVCRVRLCRDKTASKQMLAKLETEAALARRGLADPAREKHRQRPLTEHLDDYCRELEARDNDPRYVRLVYSRLKALLDGCDFRFLPDLSASRVMGWLAGLRTRGQAPAPLPKGKDLFTLTEVAALLGITVASVSDVVARYSIEVVHRGERRRRRLLRRAAVEALQDRRAQGVSTQTANYYLSHVKSFCRWLVKDRRMTDNPLAHPEAGNTDLDRRHDRRELEADKLRRLLEGTGTSARTFRGLSGRDRFHLYATACGTGFRAGGLASLTPESFDLDADPPTVTLAARRNKSRRTKVQPLPPDVAELLREYLRDMPARQPVWGETWAESYKGAEMLRLDLEAAGIPYAVEGPDGLLFADFHALRHTYLTLGGRAGIDLRTLQELAGHSSPDLTARYSHRRLYDLAGAVQKLPRFLPGPDTEGETLRATGTDAARLDRALTKAARFPAPSVRTPERTGAGGEPEADCRNPLNVRKDESACERLRTAEQDEAPPGFEPGMADLQTA